MEAGRFVQGFGRVSDLGFGRVSDLGSVRVSDPGFDLGFDLVPVQGFGLEFGQRLVLVEFVQQVLVQLELQVFAPPLPPELEGLQPLGQSL